MAMMNEMEYRTIGKALAGGYRAAVYCRLSKDDDLQGESASIANQRDMLEKYCEKQGWEVVAVYQDDGFTGLNMERPDLQRMLRAIERRQINLVITKDLSRLGRNYLQTGHLIEDFFPRNGVRYIAMNDGRGCGQNLGPYGYPADKFGVRIPLDCLYSRGLIPPRESLIRFSQYQCRY